MSKGTEYSVYGVHSITTNNAAFAAVFKEDSKTVFDTQDVEPEEVKKGYRGYVPWGKDNLAPREILKKIRRDEVMSSNMGFNVSTGYGRGIRVTEGGGKVTTPEIKKFIRRSNMVRYAAEQITDMKHFFFTVLTFILDKEGKNIALVRHVEAVNCRFETCNPKTGKGEHVFIANWEDNPEDKDVQAIPLLDEWDPVGDLLVRMGKEANPVTGKTEATIEDDRRFAVVIRMPTPGYSYYPFAYYYSTFMSGWYDLKSYIPIAKKAKMNNGMQIKYLVELHKDYFDALLRSEGITDPVEKEARKKKEAQNIKDFLSGLENQNKSWFSTYYIDPNGKEVKMVRIERIGGEKEGGDWIEDSEEASNIVSYAQGVHPSLIGSSPGKNKNINGTEARELFTMKQALEKLPRDLILQPLYAISEANGWDLEFDIPDLMLTTLDKKTDAVETTQKIEENDDTDK